VVLTVASSSNDFCCVMSVRNMANKINNMVPRIAILHGITAIVMEHINISSSEGEASEDENVMCVIKRKKKLPKLENYVENIVPACSDRIQVTF